MVTVAFDGFEVSCPATMTEGQSYQCSVGNTAASEAEWPTVGLMHSSEDANRALVVGSPLDVAWGAPLASSSVVSTNWWIGAELIGFSRFDETGKASANQSRSFTVVVADDERYEPAETFYVGMIASGSKNMTAMFNNKAAVTIAASDSLSDDSSLSELRLSHAAGGIALVLSEGVTTYSVTVLYDVTELVAVPVASDSGASVAVDGVVLERPKVADAGVARALRVGVTTLSVVVTPADGATATTYTLDVTRAAHAEGAAAVVAVDGFALSCPYRIWEGLQQFCKLSNANDGDAAWPVVGVVHSSLDTTRALVAPDSVIDADDAAYSKDVRFWPETADAGDSWDYGHGDLFPGSITSTRVAYGYERVDLAGTAAAGEHRWVRLLAAENSDTSSTEQFYVALAADGDSSLSGLLSSRAPVLIADASSEAPATQSVTASTRTPRTLSILVETTGEGGYEAHLRWRPSGSSDSWAAAVARSEDGTAVFELGALEPDTAYSVEASLDPGFASEATTEATITTPASLLSSVAVSGTTMTLLFISDLDIASTPAGGDFSVSATNASTAVTRAPKVTGAVVAGSTVTLTLSAAVRASDTVAVGYTVGTNPIRLSGGQQAESFADVSAVNSTPLSADALLGGLSLSGTVLVPAFAADVLAYAATVPNTTAAVTVTASAADDNATVATVPGAFDAVADGHVVPLSVGANTVTVTVAAEDHTTTAAYVVTVTRAANTAPGFAAGPVSRPLAENSPGGTALGAAVTATDADQGQELTYSLHGADGSAFAIDVSSGQISTAAGHVYDFEKKSQYQFSVVATDDGSPPMSATAQVTVTLSNVAEVPAVPEPRRSAAARDSITVTWEVPAVGGGPPVSGYDVRYRATGSAVWREGPQDLSVTRATLGSLEVGTEYEIAVRAANDDGDSGWTDPPLRVSTQRSADAMLGGLSLSGTVLVPAFAADVLAYAATVPNTTAAVTVTASAADDNATVATVPGAFDAVADGHVVPLSVGANTVTVTVAAEDHTATVAYVVTVTRAANTAPAFAAGPVSRSLAENSPGGTALGAAATATDADQGQELTYSLHGADGSAFAIDASSGQISTAPGHDYDFEKKSQYQFSVVATDDGSPPMSATAQVTVTLSNVAEVPAVPEPRRSAAARDSITVTWEVPAVGGGPPVSSYDVRYRATGNAVWRDGPQDLSVTRATVGSLEVNTEYEIAVRAANDDGDSGWTDPPLRLSTTQRSADAMLGGLSLSGTVLVPAFAADVLAYAATVPNTTAAVTVTASAADDNATVATVPGAFDAVADGHVVPLSVGANTITVTVTAEDRTTTAAYVVTVTRAANTAPVFAAGPVSRPLAENSPGGTALGAAVTATDADQGHKLTYSLHGADGSAFAIDVSSGQISTVPGHDYDIETKSQYQFSVVATDDGSPPMSATTQVTVTLSNVAEVPAVPEPRRSAAARDSITVTWEVPAVGGGPPVSGYDVRYRATGSAVWREGPQDLSVTRATLGSLEVNTEYEIAVRAANDDGDSGWTDPPLRVSTQRSANAMLGGLSLSGTVLVPAFAADVLAYAATVPNTTAAVTVTASAADDNATVATVPGAFDAVADGHVVPLSVGANTITVTVTAEDHTATAAYVVTVTRLPETVAPTLTSARIDGDVLVLSYDEPLDAGSKPAAAAFSVRIADAVTSAARSVGVTGVSIEDDSVQLSLDSASRHRDTVTVTYQAPASDAIADLAGNQAARLSGHRAANTTAPAAQASLDSLVLSDVDTRPAFSPASFEYTADVAGLVAVTTVTATPVDQRAVVSITPDDASPTPGFQVDLIGGTNTITVTVTAEDAATAHAYTVAVTRRHETAPPRLTTAAAAGDQLTLAYSETLDAGSVPPLGAFAVAVTDARTQTTRAAAVAHVDVDADTVTLTLHESVRAADTVAVSYSAPAQGPLRDTSANNAAALAQHPVANSTLPATDTALSALTLTGLALDRHLAPGTLNYQAAAAFALDHTTIRAAPADPRATAEILDPPDADPSQDGHQVALVTGDNTLRVRVTAEDPAVNRIYVINVTRDAPHLPPQPQPPTPVAQPPLDGSAATRDTSDQPAFGTRDTQTRDGTRDAQTRDGPPLPAFSTLSAPTTTATSATLHISVADQGADPINAHVRYRLATAAGARDWISISTAVTDGTAQIILFGLSPSAQYSVQGSLDPTYPTAATQSATFTTEAATAIAHTQDELQLAPFAFIYGRNDVGHNFESVSLPYDLERSPPQATYFFEAIRIDSSNIDNSELEFSVEYLPDKSSQQFCWHPEIVTTLTTQACHDLEIKAKPASGWLYMHAGIDKTGSGRNYRAWSSMSDYPVSRATIAAAATGERLKAYRDVIVRPPDPVVDCSDYPERNRERFNCIFNGEKLPPKPNVDSAADLLDDTLNLLQNEDNYELVFREEFDSNADLTPCQNLAELRRSVWDLHLDTCGSTDANGSPCEGVIDGAFYMTSNWTCSSSGMQTAGLLAFKYGYVEVRFKVRMHDYSKYTNINMVLGDSRQSRKWWLNTYGVDIDGVESATTNLAHEVDMFECIDNHGTCYIHQYLNPNSPRQYLKGITGRRMAIGLSFCYGTYGIRVLRSNHRLCADPPDVELNITLGLEWTPRGYRHSWQIDEVGPSFSAVRAPSIEVAEYSRFGNRYQLHGSARDKYFEHLVHDDEDSVLERIAIAHVPLPLDLGSWNQGMTAAFDTNETRLAVDYIRIYQPRNRYADMEPVYQ